MSEYRICVLEIENRQLVQHLKFDNKEDAEHYAKNHSSSDNNHIYEVQKNDHGDFATIKSYSQGQVV